MNPADGKQHITPIVRTAEIGTLSPVDLYELLCGEMDNSFLLESLEGEEKVARYSILGFDSLLQFQSKNDDITITTGTMTEHEHGDPLSVLKQTVSRFQFSEPDVPLRFSGGAVGYFSYDIVRFIEHLPDTNPDDLDLPDCHLIIPRIVIVFDHRQGTIIMLFNGLEDEHEHGVSMLDSIEETVNTLHRETVNEEFKDIQAVEDPELHSNMTKRQFKKMVERSKEYILAGDIFQVVLSQRFQADVSCPPFSIFRTLRKTNSSPYMYYLNYDGIRVIGTSPEILVRLEGDVVETRPLAGTRRRGETPEEDRELIEDLLSDEKEKAEHIMLVDLGRNDIGRVCRAGTVKVTELLGIEKYSQVMHIVSNVEGILKDDQDPYEVLRASFPAGTVSGAPKVRAMEIIDEMEPTRRGIYAGAVGYISFSGNLDTCIAIRTIVMKDRTAYIQAGAGIVADSSPDREYQETLEKAKALFRAVAIAENNNQDM